MYTSKWSNDFKKKIVDCITLNKIIEIVSEKKEKKFLRSTIVASLHDGIYYFKFIHSFVFLDKKVYLFYLFVKGPSLHATKAHNITRLKRTKPANTASISIYELVLLKYYQSFMIQVLLYLNWEIDSFIHSILH